MVVLEVMRREGGRDGRGDGREIDEEERRLEEEEDDMGGRGGRGETKTTTMTVVAAEAVVVVCHLLCLLHRRLPLSWMKRVRVRVRGKRMIGRERQW